MKNELQKTISVRTLHTIEELTLVKNLESLVWADDDPVPVNHTSTVVKNGGMAIGAFAGDELIGFQYSFPGYDGTNVYLYSHSMGIHPGFRRLGIGEKLKRKQREVALEKGYSLIVWTYDPLETVNGYLNLSKLGGVCTRYIENCYGEMPDILNAGLPSDRFLVEWKITEESAPLEQKEETVQDNQKIPLLLEVDFDIHGLPIPISVFLDKEDTSNVLRVPVPSQFQNIKSYNLDLALNWRLRTRQVFTHYLNRGWVVTALRKSESPSLHYYVLNKKKA